MKQNKEIITPKTNTKDLEIHMNKMVQNLYQGEESLKIIKESLYNKSEHIQNDESKQIKK
tara:strand:- start:781 stop:960 length:180 start_codon:yes stop_codon:yes gene_type:complete